MTSDAISRNEEIVGRTRGLLIAVERELLPRTVEIVSELIDHNECAIAIEMMSEMLNETGGSISSDALNSLSELVAEMGLDEITVARLTPRVRD
jgi:hypothetical protein